MMRDASGLQYFLTDHLGSTVAITDSNGTLTSQQRYLPFGGTRANVTSPNSPGTDFGYTGQRQLDAGMGGLMDYKARFYSPYLNRFIQPDTITPGGPQGLNRYSYALNNPIRYNDPDGHCPICIGLVLIGSFFIFNGTSDSYQPNLSAEELQSRETSVYLGVAITLTGLSIKSKLVEAAANIYDCATGGYCGPEMALPGSYVQYSKLDDIDAPRLTLAQRIKINQLAQDNNCSITICGGYAETTLGIENRTIGFQLAPRERIGPIPKWRNTGAPQGLDLDICTPIGSSLPKAVRDGLTEIIGIPPKDNYNTKSFGNLLFFPPGSLTFPGNGTAVHKLAPWQKKFDWK